MLVGIECDDCFDEKREDPFTLEVEHLLDGSHVWYCANGHMDVIPSRKLVNCQHRGRNVYLPISMVAKWGKTPLSGIVYHQHSGYDVHIATRKHKQTGEKGRRYRTLEEFREARK